MKKHSNKSLTLFLTLMMMLTAFVTPPVNGHSSTRTDIPTWYQGDSWTYEGTVWGEGTNWSIDATIQDLKNLVTGIVTVTENGEEYECYQVEITGTIKGNFTWDILSGEIDGVIEGTSYYRISDLAQVKTHIHSYGEVDMPLPLDYEYNSTNTFNPPLENFDFPIKVGEQWEISSQVTTESHFYLEGLYDETSSNTSWVNKTLECTKKQTVKTPAGSFNSFLITNPNDEADDSLFYSPKAGNIVKGEVYYSDENNSFEAHINLKTYSRKTQPLTITETLFPLEFIQGEEVKISGKITNSETGEPIKNTVISIEIPATEETYHTTTDDNGNYEKTITPHVIQDHTPSTIEIGSDGVIVKCTKGSLTGYRVKTLVSIDHNTPPKKPMYINGVTKGYANETYSYSTSTYDLNYDQLYYLFDWGGGSNGSWVGPIEAEASCTVEKRWNNTGVYEIMVKTRDWRGAESPWSEPVTVEIAPEFIVDAGDLYRAQPGETIQFHGSATGGYPPYSWHWDFGDGTNSSEQNPTHAYTTTGFYTAVLTVTDNISTTKVDEAVVIVGKPDTTPPTISVEKPVKGVYVNNNKILPFFATIVFGSVEIRVNVTDESEVTYMVFSIDDTEVANFTTPPYNWTWDEKTFGRHVVEVTASDFFGNIATKKIVIWRFF